MSYRVRIGGVLRCCFVAERPDEASEGTVVSCAYCHDGLKLVTRDGETAWEALWITNGHRAAPGKDPTP